MSDDVSREIIAAEADRRVYWRVYWRIDQGPGDTDEPCMCDTRFTCLARHEDTGAYPGLTPKEYRSVVAAYGGIHLALPYADHPDCDETPTRD